MCRLLISIDVGTSLLGVAGNDETVFEIDASGTAFQLRAFDPPSTLNDSWTGVDLSALWARPTPIIDELFSDGFE